MVGYTQYELTFVDGSGVNSFDNTSGSGNTFTTLKNGFFPSTCCGWRINSSGRIGSPYGGGYVMTILSDRWGVQADGINAIEVLARMVNERLALRDPTRRSPIGALDPARRAIEAARGAWENRSR